VSGSSATLMAAGATWFGGAAVTLSMTVWDSITVLGLGLFDFLDQATSSWLLPISGLGMAIFVSRAIVPDLPEGPVKTYLRAGLTYIAPLGIVVLIWSKAVGF
ncbi:MAG: hypothetical protein AAFY01_12810, partial [Pseudomonadota bacterium]